MAQKIHTTTTGDVSGNTLGYTFDFPSLAQDDIRVSVAGVLKTLTTDYTIEQWSATGSTSNFIQFVNSTKRGTGTVRIFRETPKTNPKASFTSGSAIKADDLNNNQKQAIYVAEEFEDDMTNLAANDTSGFSINGSNIADNSITSTKIAGLNVEESDIANDAVTANKLKSSTSTDSVRAVTTNHIRDGAVTDAKIAGVAGSKVTPDFGSQNIVTTGSASAAQLTLSKDNPTITLTDDNNNPDYQIGNINGVLRFQDTTNNATRFQVNTDGHIDFSPVVDFASNINVTGTCTATTFSGSGASLTNLPSSALSGALPAIDGSALTNLNNAPMALSKVGSVIQSGDFTLPQGQNTFVIAGDGNMTRSVTAQSDDTYIWVNYKLMFSTNSSITNSLNRVIYKVSLYKNGAFNQDILSEVDVQSNSLSTNTASASFKFIPTSFSTNDSIEVRVLHRSNSTGSSYRGVFKSGSYLNVFCVDVN